MQLKFTFILFLVALTAGCSPQKEETHHEEIKTETQEDIKPDEPADMSNPVLIYGSDIGNIFKTYYKVGNFSEMVRYTDKTTVSKYGADSLMKIYRKLNLGYDIKLKSMTAEGNEKILHYESSTFATKGVKRLHVVIENDTARIVPQHLESGDIFE